MSRVRFALYFFALSVCATAAFASTAIGHPVPIDSLALDTTASTLSPYSAAPRMPGLHQSHFKETHLVLASSG